MGIEEGAVRVEVDSRGTCSVVSRVVVDICSIKNSGALGHKEWRGLGLAHGVRKRFGGKMRGMGRCPLDPSIDSGRL